VIINQEEEPYKLPQTFCANLLWHRILTRKATEFCQNVNKPLKRW